MIVRKPQHQKMNNKFKNSQPQVENLDYTENKMKIDEMKQNITKKLIKLPNTVMKNKALIKKKNYHR